MLYTTTRSRSDTYTAHRVLMEDRAPDGGFYIPFRMPEFNRTQMNAMKMQSFGETVAQVLGVFFSTGLTGEEVDGIIGKSPAKLICMSHRVIFVQFWNNPEGEYAYICRRLYQKLIENQKVRVPTDWAKIAIRIAVLFGIYSLLPADRFDISVPSGDFSLPMAVWYARKMGLPVGMILCACNENNAPWDFIHRGELSTGVAKVSTGTPELDVSNPPALERLIFATLGHEQNEKYLEASRRKKLYQINPEQLSLLSAGLFVSVVGKDRVPTVISSVYRSNLCILDPYTAISYGSMQDFRAKTGEGNPTVLLWDSNPLNTPSLVSKATGLTLQEIKKILNQI